MFLSCRHQTEELTTNYLCLILANAHDGLKCCALCSVVGNIEIARNVYLNTFNINTGFQDPTSMMRNLQLRGFIPNKRNGKNVVDAGDCNSGP